MQIGAEPEIYLGISNYQTENFEAPIRIKRETLHANPTITLSVNGKPFCADISPIFQPVTDIKQQREFYERYVTVQARKIYDDYSLTADEKIQRILDLKAPFVSHISPEVNQSIMDRLIKFETQQIKNEIASIIVKAKFRFQIVPTGRNEDGTINIIQLLVPQNPLWKRNLTPLENKKCKFEEVENLKKQLIDMVKQDPTVKIPKEASIYRGSTDSLMSVEKQKSLAECLKNQSLSFEVLDMGSMQSKPLPSRTTLSAPVNGAYLLTTSSRDAVMNKKQNELFSASVPHLRSFSTFPSTTSTVSVPMNDSTIVDENKFGI